MLPLDIVKMIIGKLPLIDLQILAATKHPTWMVVLNDMFWNNVFVERFGPIVESYFTPRRRIIYATTCMGIRDVCMITSKSFIGRIGTQVGLDCHDKPDVFWLAYYIKLGSKVRIEYPVDHYADIPFATRIYEHADGLTVAMLIGKINAFYAEFLTEEELQKQHDFGNEYAEDWHIEDRPTRTDMFPHMFLEGWDYMLIDEQGEYLNDHRRDPDNHNMISLMIILNS